MKIRYFKINFKYLFFAILSLQNLEIYSSNLKNENETHQEPKAPKEIQQKPKNQFVTKYIVQEKLKPKGLTGISDEQIDDHWKLYKGYIENVNKLNDELAQMRSEGKGNSLDYSDRRRRFDFEYNGMVLHEYYFGNLGNPKNKKVNKELEQDLVKYFDSFEDWKNDFKQAAKTRGIGWAVLCYDPATGNLINIFVQDHENGNIASFQPLLVMDVWEHAYMVDYFATEKANYIDAFMENINWPIVAKRYKDAKNGILNNRYNLKKLNSAANEKDAKS